MESFNLTVEEKNFFRHYSWEHSCLEQGVERPAMALMREHCSATPYGEILAMQRMVPFSEQGCGWEARPTEPLVWPWPSDEEMRQRFAAAKEEVLRLEREQAKSEAATQ